MPRLGRNRIDPEPWIEQLIQDYGTPIPPDRAVKATVVGAKDLTESQDETDASCVVFLSDGVVFIPAVLTTQAWARLQDMEERESFSGLENAIVSVKSLQLNFHLEPELSNCQFYVTVNQMSTVGQASTHNAVPNCTRLDESSSQSQYGFRLTDLLEEWEKNDDRYYTPQEMTDKPATLSEPTTSHHILNTPPGPSTSHPIMDSSAEPSPSYQYELPPTSSQWPPLLEEEEETEHVRLLRGIMRRLAPTTPSQSHDVATPTRWDQDRLAYKVEEGFSLPAHHLLIPEDQRGLITTATAASTSSSTPSDLVCPPCDRQTDQPTSAQISQSDQPITTHRDIPDQLPSSGERTDDSPPCSGVLAEAEAESQREGGAWDVFAPVIDMLRSPSSSEISATPEDLPILQSQSAVVMPENLPLFQSQSDSATPDNLPHTKIQSDSVTPENLPVIQEAEAATPRKAPLLLGCTSLDSHSGSSSTEKFTFHQSLLARLSPNPVGASTQNVPSTGSLTERTGFTLPPYQAQVPSGLSPVQFSGKRFTPEEEDDEDANVARSPPSWIAQTQWTERGHCEGGSEPKRRMFLSPSKQTQVHTDGSAFSHKYQVSVQDICSLGNFKVPAEEIDWAMRYLLASSHTSAEAR
ncbi:hypothetical protein ACEWY4_016696 [Coilia grayii]|uniref:Shelterin complex subunit TPP1/Est3 domain-containing protein n=1 Tax=Coilia grayii TaxID=363190 RepID=A0ABD1JL38_9TELE